MRNGSPARIGEAAAPGRSGGIVGVLGGMGPAATADFYAKLVRATPAENDQQHLRVVIWSDPTVPDRTDALLGHGPDPTPWLIHGARVLREAGAGSIAVPCNTAHAFLPAVVERVGVPIVHMIDEVARQLAGSAAPPARVGLLATTGTVTAGLYHDWLGRAGIDVVTPDEDSQRRRVMPAIHAIKAGFLDGTAARLLLEAAERLADQGAEAVIAGCTEIPLALRRAGPGLRVVDPTQVLAEAVVAQARCSRP